MREARLAATFRFTLHDIADPTAAMVTDLLLLGETPESATLIGAGLILAGAMVSFLGGLRRYAMLHSAMPCAEVIHPDRSTGDVHAFFLEQLENQRAEAERHRASLYWADMNTGRNISMDEFEAIRAMERIAAGPSEAESGEPKAYADRLLSDLAQSRIHFRATARDTDGYGIATIGTIERSVRNYAFIAPFSPQQN